MQSVRGCICVADHLREVSLRNERYAIFCAQAALNLSIGDLIRGRTCHHRKDQGDPRDHVAYPQHAWGFQEDWHEEHKQKQGRAKIQRLTAGQVQGNSAHRGNRIRRLRRTSQFDWQLFGSGERSLRSVGGLALSPSFQLVRLIGRAFC
jgi:hypothetical protein